MFALSILPTFMYLLILDFLHLCSLVIEANRLCYIAGETEIGQYMLQLFVLIDIF